MTPRDKAYELIHRHLDKIDGTDVIWTNVLYKWILAKQCALITVDEFLNGIETSDKVFVKTREYWESVKKEIEKL